MPFWEGNDYADAALAELFEGVPSPYNFSEADIHDMRQVQSGILLRRFSDYGRQLVVSNQLLLSLTDIMKVVNGDTSVKYRYYSAHDTNIANHLTLYVP